MTTHNELLHNNNNDDDDNAYNEILHNNMYMQLSFYQNEMSEMLYFITKRQEYKCCGIKPV